MPSLHLLEVSYLVELHKEYFFQRVIGIGKITFSPLFTSFQNSWFLHSPKHYFALSIIVKWVEMCFKHFSDFH